MFLQIAEVKITLQKSLTGIISRQANPLVALKIPHHLETDAGEMKECGLIMDSQIGKQYHCWFDVSIILLTESHALSSTHSAVVSVPGNEGGLWA